jgi:hypothetical protein
MIVKIHFDYDKFKHTHKTLELLCDLELILGLQCFMPMLKVVQTFIKYVQHWDVFIIIIVDVVNPFEVELFHLYIDPVPSLDDLVFDDFPKLLQ